MRSALTSKANGPSTELKVTSDGPSKTRIKSELRVVPLSMSITAKEPEVRAVEMSRNKPDPGELSMLRVASSTSMPWPFTCTSAPLKICTCAVGDK